MNQAAFVDVETSGFKASEHEIIELAIVLFTFDPKTGKILKVIDHYTGLREPSINIPKQSTKIHGLTMDDVKGKQIDDLKVAELIYNAEFIVAHNAKFDYPFLVKYLPDFKERPWHCSMEQVSWGNGSRSLTELAKKFKVKNESAHRAISDVKTSLRLLNVKRDNGKTFFHDILTAPKMLDEELEPKQAEKQKMNFKNFVKQEQNNINIWPYIIIIFTLTTAGALLFGFSGALGGIALSVLASVIIAIKS